MTTWADIVKGDAATTDTNLSQGAEPAPETPPQEDHRHHHIHPTPKTSSILPPPATPPTLDKSLPSIHPEHPPAVDKLFGDDHTTKLPNNFRFLFNNINGLPLTSTSLLNFAAITK